MTDTKKINIDDVIKALECCAKNNCTYDCPFYHDSCIKCKYSSSEIIKLAFDTISHLKKENDDLFYKLQGVMWSVDKWLDGKELEQDEVNRAIAMREKTLQITEQQQTEIKRLEKARQRQAQFLGEERGQKYELLNKIGTVKTEAIKEFAVRLKCGVPQETGVIRCADVDNLVKEMVGVNNVTD